MQRIKPWRCLHQFEVSVWCFTCYMKLFYYRLNLPCSVQVLLTYIQLYYQFCQPRFYSHDFNLPLIQSWGMIFIIFEIDATTYHHNYCWQVERIYPASGKPFEFSCIEANTFCSGIKRKKGVALSLCCLRDLSHIVRVVIERFEVRRGSGAYIPENLTA